MWVDPRVGVVAPAQLVSSIACACTAAIGDEPRLRAAITEPLGTALRADCGLVIAGDVARAASETTVELALRYHDVVIGTLRLTRQEPFTAEELQLAGLVADHAATAWSMHALDLSGVAAIVSSTDDAIIGKTLDGIITSWNPGASKLFGYTAEEARGQSITLLVPPDRLAEQALLLARLSAGEVTQLETIRRRKDGERVEVAVTSSPVYDSGGRMIGASKVARDITSRRAAERALALAMTAAKDANRELEAFSYSVAHDLRAPLRAVIGFSGILLEDYGHQVDTAGRELIDDIRRGALAMGTLIDALLSLARTTRTELHREAIDLAEIARRAAAALAAVEPTREVEVTVAGPLIADADARLASVLVDNLVGNAWKFTGKTAHAAIDVGELTRDGTRVFFIRDNGAGFDMARATNLFAPFQRLHGDREFAGSGIGLATAQRVVHRHGGRIWAESAPNAGATFYFTLASEEESRACANR